MTLSDALTHRDEPSAVLDTMSHVDKREMNVPRVTRMGIFIRETRRNGWGRMSVCERERGREGGELGRDRYRRFPVSCHVLRRAFELYEETPSMNYS